MYYILPTEGARKVLNFGPFFVDIGNFNRSYHPLLNHALLEVRRSLPDMLKTHLYIVLYFSDNEEKKRGKFNLPQNYDRSYRIPFSIVPEDLAYKLRLEQDRRSERERGRKDKSLTMDHLHEFRTSLRHFIHFKQKQKVCCVV